MLLVQLRGLNCFINAVLDYAEASAFLEEYKKAAKVREE